MRPRTPRSLPLVPPSLRRRARPAVEALERRELLASSVVTVTNANDSGAGSLRAAITAVNDPASGLNTIDFDIPGPGVHTIALQTGLPWLSQPVTIDEKCSSVSPAEASGAPAGTVR